MKPPPSVLPWLLVLCHTLSACLPAAGVDTAAAEITVETPALPTGTVSSTPSPPASTAAITLPTSTPTVPPPAAAFCPPLEGYTYSQIESSVVNAFNPPSPGSDDPHQGVDIAELIPGSQVAVAGRPVFAILEGQAALMIRDRFPYGNAVLVETPLKSLPADWLQQLQTQPQDADFSPNTALTCPQAPQEPAWKSNTNQSLYILYAHLQNPAAIVAGDPISCGQPLGEIGDSGNALNPHLHIEARIGPGGARFESMAHYDATASIEEMNAYCLWRVSGLFRLIDPLKLLQIGLE